MSSSSIPPKGSAARSAAIVVSTANRSVLTYEAIQIENSLIRKVWFEAQSPDDARAFALKCGLGLQGEGPPIAASDAAPTFDPVAAFDVPRACQHLGGISRTSLYRLLVRGKLSRLKHTRKVLVTRRSINRYLDSSS